MAMRTRLEINDVNIGHIILGDSCDEIGDHFAALVDALARQGISQHVLCSKRLLVRRLADCKSVNIGPIVGSAIMAACYMPRVDLVHVHDHKARQSALLLTLTRSIPFVISRRSESDPENSQLNRSTFRRAAALICQSDAIAEIMLDYQPTARVHVIPDIELEYPGDLQMIANQKHANRIASDHLSVYRRAVDAWSIPALLL